MSAIERGFISERGYTASFKDVVRKQQVLRMQMQEKTRRRIMCTRVQPEENIAALEARVKDGSELPTVDSGNQTCVFWKSSTHS